MPIVGAGVGALAAVRALRRMPVSVTVVDAHNYSAFPPLVFGPPSALTDLFHEAVGR